MAYEYEHIIVNFNVQCMFFSQYKNIDILSSTLKCVSALRFVLL